MKLVPFPQHRQRGATLVEAAISLPIFLLVMVAAANLAILSYKTAGLHHTLTETVRWAVLGQTSPGLTRVNSIKAKAQEFGRPYGLKLPDSNIFVCAVGSTSCSPENAGNGQSYIQLSATEPAPLFFGLFRVNLFYSVLGRNEPF